MRIIFLTVLVVIFSCEQGVKYKDYRVENKDSGNFSVQFPEIQYGEKIEIKINDETVLIKENDSVPYLPGFWYYYNYPRKIDKIEFLDYFNGKLKIKKLFVDTLVDSKQRTIIISRPYPSGMKKETWRKYGLVSIDTGDRFINLVDDNIYFKDMLTY